MRPDEPEEILRLASADNFRDVSGPDTSYVAADGTPLRRGVAYRSNELQLTDVDAATLADLGITQVLDLRHQHEIDAHPDAAVPGASWHHVEVVGIPMDEVGDLPDPAAAEALMRRLYVGYAERPGAHAAYAEVLRRIAEADAPVLFHCTAGKDRTGWTAMLLLHVAGVDRGTIVEDYLLTNTFSSATRAKYTALVEEHLGPEQVAVYDRVMVVDESYLGAGLEAAEAAYGSLDGYVRDALGLTASQVERLRARLRA